MNKKGHFIVLEGLDRCGKTTQAKLITDELKDIYGDKVVSISFPNRDTAIGGLIDKCFKKEITFNHETIQLLCIANRWEYKEEIENLLKEGYIIVCDRYIYSGIAYGMANGLDKGWVEQPNEGLPDPDLILYLDISIEQLKIRDGYGEELYEREELQTRVKEAYEHMVEVYEFIRVNANTSKEVLKDSLIDIIEDLIDKE